jgi:hypothetical protein
MNSTWFSTPATYVRFIVYGSIGYLTAGPKGMVLALLGGAIGHRLMHAWVTRK